MKNYTLQEVFVKLSSYCVYQERSRKECWDKMADYDLSQDSRECVIDLLKEEDFLNESRFVRAYAGGKFRVKKWGRHKIKNGLRQKGISDKLIQVALKQIDEQEYRDTLGELLEKKTNSLDSSLNDFEIKKKLFNYASAKGYESSLIFELAEPICKNRS